MATAWNESRIERSIAVQTEGEVVGRAGCPCDDGLTQTMEDNENRHGDGCVQDDEEMTNYLPAALALLERELQVDLMRRQDVRKRKQAVDVEMRFKNITSSVIR